MTISSLHGKFVAISFRATWCGYRMKEISVLDTLVTEINGLSSERATSTLSVAAS